MKKFLTALTVIIIIAVLSNCGKRKLPGGPLDGPATPTPAYLVNVQLLAAQTPVTNTAVNILTSDLKKTYCGGYTNAGGFANVGVGELGLHYVAANVAATPASGMGYVTVTDTVNVQGNKTDKTVNITPGSFTMTQISPASCTWTASGGTYNYQIVYHNTVGLYYSISTIAGSPALNGVVSNAQVTMDKNYVDNDGDCVNVSVVIPPYYQVAPSEGLPNGSNNIPVNFSASGGLYAPSIPVFYLYAGWYFMPSSSSPAFSAASGTTSFSMTVSFNNPTGISWNNIGVKVAEYQYMDTNAGWVDHSACGGMPTYQINGITCDINQPYYFLNSNNFTLLLEYTGCDFSGFTPAEGLITLNFVQGNQTIYIMNKAI